jgi:extradiol dioxygenase family protein
MKFFLLLIFHITLSNEEKNKRYDIYMDMLNWGKQNELKINNIALNFTAPFEEKYIGNKEIKSGDKLMIIPRKILITFDDVLKLSSKKEKKIWELLSKEPTYKMKVKYQSFIAYIIMKSYKKKKGKLYKHFKQFLEFSYTNDIDSLGNRFPIFYSMSEYEIFGNSICGSKVFKTKENLIQEHQIITRHLNIDFDLDEYMAFRTQNELFKTKFENISYIIPFINLFSLHPKYYNAEFNFNSETNEIEIKSIRDIGIGEVITLKNEIEDNCDNLLYYGITYDYSQSKSYKPHLPIKLYTDPYDEYVIDKNLKRYVDIKYDGYIDSVLEDYNINRPGPSNSSNLRFFYDGLQRYLYEFGVVKTRDYYDKIFNEKTRTNIKRIYESERKLIVERMDELNEIIKKKSQEEKEERKKSKNKKTTDL